MRKINYILIVLLSAVLVVIPASATTYYVDDDGGYDFTTINAALHATSVGDEVFVYNGTYNNESNDIVQFYKSNTMLVGEGADVVTIDCNNKNAGIAVSIYTGCVVEGVKVVNSKFGIRLDTSNHTVRDCVFDGMTYSDGTLMTDGADNCLFENNRLINSTGMYSAMSIYCHNSSILNNTFTDNSGAGFTVCVQADGNIIAYNNFTSNGYAGIEFYSAGEGNKVYLNNFIGNGVTATTSGTAVPALTYWNSTEPIDYTYNGATYSGHLGNFWGSAYTGTDADGDGIGDTPYTLPDGLGTDYAPLIAGYENYLHPNEPQDTPVANFSAVPLSGHAPLAVQFTDLSTGSPTAWDWDFDNDGNVDSTEQNPSYTYNAAGNYTVNLTVTNAGGSDSEVKDAYIVVSESLPEDPVANFTATPTSGNAPLTVNFTDASTGTVSSYAWDFDNDGNVDSTEQNPVHTYVAEGNYTVSLTVTSAGGSNSEMKPDYITVSKSYIPAEPGEDWPSFQKDIHNTGLTSDRGPITAPDEEVSWDVYTHGTGMAGIDTVPVVVNGSVYVVSTDGYVRAINRTTGALNWETPIPDCSGFQLGNPAYGNGKIFVPTADSRIFAFDAWTGTELWNDSVESNKPSSSSLYHQLNTPVVYDNGRIYFGQWIPANYAGKYYCYTEDGTEVWNRDCTNGNKGYYWAGATVVGDYLVFGGDDGYLTSLYKVNGTLVDEINIGAGEIRSTLVYDEESNRIFTSTKNGYCISIEMNPEGTFNDSSKVQSASFDAQSTSTPVIYNGRVYLGSGNFQASSPFFCLNSTDLSVIWRFTGTNGGIQSSPVVSTAYDDGDGEVYIYFTTNARYSRLYCLKDNATNTNMTSEEWYFQPEDSKNQYTLQGVALVGGWLYYGNDKGYLFGLAGVQNGSEIPVADFNAAPLSGNSPLTVNFTDDSTGSPTSWFWDFGDGTNSTEQNPSYTYTSAGNYTVNLTVANAAGSDSEVKTDYISVSEPLPSAPVANFSADITSGVGPLAVQFTESSTGSPTAWEWDFNNDGNVDSTEQNPQFIYTGEGTYSVKLTVTNSEGNDSELKIDYISVVYPSPDFIANVTEGTVPLTVEFTGNVSGLAPDYWNMWAWDVDGDGTYDYSPNFNITHTYTEPGTYDVVVAYDGWTPNVKAGYITVLPEIPVANFSADVTSGLEPLTVNFTDQSEGIVSSYSWDFDNDGTVDSIEQNPSYTYESAGNYTVSLTVSNAGGSDSELKTDYIVVSEPVPEAPVANFTATPTAGNAPLTVNFTDQSEGIVSSYSWDFDNDGNVDSTEQNPSHTYESAGNYTVSLTVSNAGGSDSELKTDYITVSSTPVEPEPVAAFTADVTGGTAPLTVNFTDQSTGSPTAWAWDFGDGANSTEQNPSHTYVSAGNYTVNLTVENAAGMDFELKTNYIEVSETSGSTVTLYFDPESSSVSENESTEINIVASNFPAGLSGYNLTVAIDDPVVAEIVDIAYPTWALISENSTLPATSIYMKTVDLEDAVKEGATDVVLATLTVSGKEKGSANLSIGVKRLEEDSGDSIEPALLAGTIEVTLLSPLPDQEYAPKDLDGDGLYEDLTGNGEFSFVDIVAYFHNMDWIEENMPVEYFDFNGNGRIDFDDVVRMFGMI